MAPKREPLRSASGQVSARLTDAEKTVLDTLLTRRAADMEAQGMPGDDSFTGWLRWIIRQQAKVAGIPMETAAPIAPASSAPSAAPKRSAPSGERSATKRKRGS